MEGDHFKSADELNAEHKHRRAVYRHKFSLYAMRGLLWYSNAEDKEVLDAVDVRKDLNIMAYVGTCIVKGLLDQETERRLLALFAKYKALHVHYTYPQLLVSSDVVK